MSSKLRKYKCSIEPKIKQIETIEEFKSIAFSMVAFLGPYLYQDTLLIAKIIRICRSLLNQQIGDSIKFDVHTILDQSILPSISLVESNCALSEELWLLLRLFPYHQRYKLYSNWKSENSTALLIRTRAITMKRIKYIMKRLSKENVKQSGRQIGKLSHSNPSFLFEYVSSFNISFYSNLILILLFRFLHKFNHMTILLVLLLIH